MQVFTIFIFITIMSINVLSGQSKTYAELDSIINIETDHHPLTALNKVINILRDSKDMPDSTIFNFRKHKAIILNRLGLFDESLAEVYECIDMVEKGKSHNNKSQLYNFVGNVFFQMQDFQKSLEYHEMSKKMAIVEKNFHDTLTANSEIGLMLVVLGSIEKGINLQLNTLKTASALKNEYIIINIIDNLSNSYNEINNHEEALRYQLKLLDFGSIKDNRHYTAGTHQHLAEIYINLKNFDQAEVHAKIATDQAKLLGSKDWLFDCYKNMSDIKKNKGDYKAALDFQKLYVALKDSVYQKNYDTKMSAMANIYEVKQKNQQIELYEKTKLIDQAKIRLLSLIAFVFGLSGLVYYLFSKNKHYKIQQEAKDIFSTQLINAQETERQRIATELHDSVGQNLLFLKNQLNAIPIIKENSTIVSSVDQTLEEIRNISKDLYPNQLEKYGLAISLQNLAEQASKVTGLFISTDIENIDDILTKNVKINFYRIVQEFINNSIKHAQATSIRVTANQVENHVILTVQDNGKGFDIQEVRHRKGSTFGLMNMEERIKMLKGTVHIESAIDKGTKSVFTIPI